MLRKPGFVAILIVVLIVSVLVGICLGWNEESARQSSAEARKAAAESLHASCFVFSEISRMDDMIPRIAYASKYGKLEDQLLEMSYKGKGFFSIGFYDIRNDYQLIVNDQPMPAASVIKLYIMIEAYRQQREGLINLQEKHILQESDKVEGSGVVAYYPNGTAFSLQELIEMMIALSDNTASNILIDRLEMVNINNTIRELGCQDTVLKWRLMSSEILDKRDENRISARDLLLTLGKIYRGQCVGPTYDQEMIRILKTQTYRNRIPAGLPSGVIVANKTGSMSWVVNDAAIVYTQKGDYILCVLNSYPPDKDSAETVIAGISRDTYNAFISDPLNKSSIAGR